MLVSLKNKRKRINFLKLWKKLEILLKICLLQSRNKEHGAAQQKRPVASHPVALTWIYGFPKRFSDQQMLDEYRSNPSRKLDLQYITRKS